MLKGATNKRQTPIHFSSEVVVMYTLSQINGNNYSKIFMIMLQSEYIAGLLGNNQDGLMVT